MSSERMKLCAVVPAAGRGTRLGLELPKLLAPLGNGETIWTVLRRKLLTVADHINVIVSPGGEPLIRNAMEAAGLEARVSLSLQPKPLGMGDAIFRGYPVWSQAATILIVWGDQVFVSAETLSKACALHSGASRTVVLPLVSLVEPYVDYVFADDGGLRAVRQTREGDRCAPNGYADIGTFVLSVPDLLSSWTAYLAQAPLGALTGETNFIPFLPYLSLNGWTVKRLVIGDPREARGINTPDDLAYLRSSLASDRQHKSKRPQ
jgi:bifunctional N-acetylglucosamine-1-phosphate-uridyltransferase/glucosamine-1-phosphate-acetyltransferase GlmU-like protein